MNKKETILIVDDEKDMRFYIENLITSFGYNAASVGSGYEAIEITLSQVLERKNLLLEVKRLKEEINKQTRYDLIFSNNKKMTDIKSIIEQVAETNITVLVRGESGTGKEWVARAIHAT